MYKYNSVLLKILVATICINSFNTLIFADSSSQAAITPISQESLLTSEDSGIKFNLYNYSKYINQYESGDWRPVSKYMPFTGSYGSGGYIPTGTSENIHLSPGRLTWEKNLTTDEYPILALESAPDLSEEDRSIGYLFGEGEDFAVDKYEAILNTPLQRDTSEYIYYKSYLNAADFSIDGNIFTLYENPERGENSASTSLECSGLNTQGNLGNAYAPEDNPTDLQGDFFPFNSRTDSTGFGTVSGIDNAGVEKVVEYYYDTDSTTDNIPEPKYWFGATLETVINQPKDGIFNNEEVIFEFSGDDDVMVYVDNMLVLDLGGAHSRSDGTINFATGLVEVYYNAPNTFGVTSCSWGDGTPNKSLHYNHKNRAENAYAHRCLVSGTGEYEGYYFHSGFDSKQNAWSLIRYFPTTLYDCYKEAFKELRLSESEIETKLKYYFEPVYDENYESQLTVTDAFGNTHLQYRFRDYTSHKFKMFYLERYCGQANLYVKFNMHTLPVSSLTIEKAVENAPQYNGEKFEFEIHLYDSNNEPMESVQYTDYLGNTQALSLENGIGLFSLADAESYTFKLQPGCTYTVYEVENSRYINTWSGETVGEIEDTGIYLVSTSVAGVELPFTGGYGKQFVIACGVLIVLSSLVIYDNRKHKIIWRAISL